MLRRPRVLPPAGGIIANRDVLYSLRDSLTRNAMDRDPKEVLCRYLIEEVGVKYWIVTNSGRSALTMALMALHRLHPGRDEVIIPAYTSYSVPAAVVRAGLRVRLCDIEVDSLGMSPKELPRVLTSRTLCVLPNHLYGMTCQLKAICEIAREHGLPVLEDAAQAMGPLSKRHARVHGDGIIFSLSRGKSIPAAGGGLIGTNDEELANACRQELGHLTHGRESAGLGSALLAAAMANFMRPSLYWLPARMPFLKLGASIYNPFFEIGSMSKFQAALAVRLLRSFTALQKLREKNAIRLRQGLETLDGDLAMRGFRVLWPKNGEAGDFLRLPVLFKEATDRDRVISQLEGQGLGATAGYPSAIHEIPELKSQLSNDQGDFPSATWVSRQLVTLPTHPWVCDRDIEQIKEIFRLCLQ